MLWTSKRKNIDDVKYVSQMIDILKKEYQIDEERVYALGMSNGAQMTFRLACELSDKIRAGAPFGSMGTFYECKAEKNPPLFVHP